MLELLRVKDGEVGLYVFLKWLFVKIDQVAKFTKIRCALVI